MEVQIKILWSLVGEWSQIEEPEVVKLDTAGNILMGEQQVQSRDLYPEEEKNTGRSLFYEDLQG